MSVKILYTQMGLVIGELVDEDDDVISIKNPRLIDISQQGVNITNYMVMFSDHVMGFNKSSLISRPLNPVKELEDAYLREFEEKSNLIISESKIIV